MSLTLGISFFFKSLLVVPDVNILWTEPYRESILRFELHSSRYMPTRMVGDCNPDALTSEWLWQRSGQYFLGNSTPLTFPTPTTLIHILFKICLTALTPWIFQYVPCFTPSCMFTLTLSWPLIRTIGRVANAGCPSKRKGFALDPCMDSSVSLNPWIPGNLVSLTVVWLVLPSSVECPCTGASLRPGESLAPVKVKTHSFPQKAFSLKFIWCWYQAIALRESLSAKG